MIQGNDSTVFRTVELSATDTALLARCFDDQWAYLLALSADMRVVRSMYGTNAPGVGRMLDARMSALTHLRATLL